MKNKQLSFFEENLVAEQLTLFAPRILKRMRQVEIPKNVREFYEERGIDVDRDYGTKDWQRIRFMSLMYDVN